MRLPNMQRNVINNVIVHMNVMNNVKGSPMFFSNEDIVVKPSLCFYGGTDDWPIWSIANQGTFTANLLGKT